MPSPYSITILLPAGEANGLRVLERPNWTGTGVAFSRTGLSEASERSELNNAGVYILVGDMPDDGSLSMVYIGEGDPVLPRLRRHDAEKDFWTSAVAFTSKGTPLNKAHIQYLEYKLIALAQERRMCRLDNQNNPAAPSISEADAAAMDEFLDKLLSILPLLSISVFEAPVRPASAAEDRLYLRGKNQAQAVQRATGFIVLQGSEAVLNSSPSCRENCLNKREALRESGRLQEASGKLIFTEDTAFTSPSYAASVILGNSTNGRDAWKNANGVSLKQLQTEEALDQ